VRWRGQPEEFLLTTPSSKKWPATRSAAMRIGAFVRQHKYETRVVNGATCNSACTLIWLAGTTRHLDQHARLGFHSAAATLYPPYERYEQGDLIMGKYLAALGVPKEVIDLQPQADPCCFNYVGHEQAQAWGLLGKVPETQTQTAIPILTIPTPKPKPKALGGYVIIRSETPEPSAGSFFKPMPYAPFSR
jgi:hypothetical protein